MFKLSDLSLNFKQAFKLEGPVFIYLLDLENRILGGNEMELQIFEEILDIPKKHIIGSLLSDLFEGTGNTADTVYTENEHIVKNKLPKQFYNIWSVNNLFQMELLTTKMPVYDTHGKVAGIFGISHCINKFSVAKALELGLSKRETECLLYLLEGKSNKEIAHVLNISVRTIEAHFDSLKSKLQCFNKTQLIIKALQIKLTENICKNSRSSDAIKSLICKGLNLI